MARSRIGSQGSARRYRHHIAAGWQQFVHCGRLAGRPWNAPAVSTDPAAYDPRTVESAAQGFWADTRAFEVGEASPKPAYYCLSLLPYPSEVGRASCRERGGQYVLFAVVAVFLNKKHTTRHEHR